MTPAVDPAPAPPTALENAQSIVDIIGTAISALALFVGAVWVYYKFVKGRTFKPRPNVESEAEWLQDGDDWFVHVRVWISNTGGSKLNVEQLGSGSQAEVINPHHNGVLPVWLDLGTSKIFVDHKWLEPGQKVSDDFLLRTSSDEKLAFRVSTTCICKTTYGGRLKVAHTRVFDKDSRI